MLNTRALSRLKSPERRCLPFVWLSCARRWQFHGTSVEMVFQWKGKCPIGCWLSENGSGVSPTALERDEALPSSRACAAMMGPGELAALGTWALDSGAEGQRDTSNKPLIMLCCAKRVMAGILLFLSLREVTPHRASQFNWRLESREG